LVFSVSDHKRKRCQTFLMFCCSAFIAIGISGAESSADMKEIEKLRDPTAPLVMGVAQPQTNLFSLVSSYRVTSILIRPNLKVAVINSRQVRVGDIIGNAEVVNIDKNSVTLQVAGEEQILELYGRSIKTLNKGEE